MQDTKNRPAKASRRVNVSNQVKLDVENPIPFENGATTFSFVNNVSYLPFLPPLDTFAADLLQARIQSITNNACIVTKKDYCAGDGFYDFEGGDLDKGFLDWADCVNLKNESAVKINKKIFEDLFTFGNVPIEVVRFTVAGKRKLFVYVHSFLEWRKGKPNSEGIVEYAVQSKLFMRNRYVTAEQLKNSKKLPLYNPQRRDKDNWEKGEDGVERTLIWYLNPVSGFEHYGLPSNVSSMIYQLLEYKGARYNLDNFDNNLVAAALLALQGNLSQEEADKIGRKIINSYTGDGKRGRTIVVASEEGITGSEFHKMDTKTDGSFIEADDRWSQKIILANQWDAVLAGIIAPGTLGKGANFLTKILEIKLNTVIRPAQKDLVTEVWKHILTIGQEWLSWKVDVKKVAIHNSIDISGLTDVDITPAVQVNEVREAKGLERDPKMDGVYMKQPSKPGQGDPSEKEEGGENV